jgi:hypothetical protein
MLDFIKEKCALGWKPGVINNHNIGNETHELPVLTRTDKSWQLWETYAEQHPYQNKKKQKAQPPEAALDALNECQDYQGWKPGRGTFLSLLRFVTAESRSKSCLSYYYVRLQMGAIPKRIPGAAKPRKHGLQEEKVLPSQHI